jgi:hypothetical protein
MSSSFNEPNTQSTVAANDDMDKSKSLGKSFAIELLMAAFCRRAVPNRAMLHPKIAQTKRLATSARRLIGSHSNAINRNLLIWRNDIFNLGSLEADSSSDSHVVSRSII